MLIILLEFLPYAPNARAILHRTVSSGFAWMRLGHLLGWVLLPVRSSINTLSPSTSSRRIWPSLFPCSRYWQRLLNTCIRKVIMFVTSRNPNKSQRDSFSYRAGKSISSKRQKSFKEHPSARRISTQASTHPSSSQSSPTSTRGSPTSP